MKPICIKTETMKQLRMKILFLGASILVGLGVHAQSIEEGTKHLNAERYVAAGKTFEALSAANPSAENLMAQGRYYLSIPEARENIDKAKALFDQVEAMEKGGTPESKIGLGIIELGKGNTDAAKALFAAAVEKRKDSKNPEYFYRIAEAYTMLPWATDAAEAILNIDQALLLDETKMNGAYYLVKAKAYLSKNEGGETMTALQNAERVKYFDMASVYSTMAKVWLQGKNYSEAKIAIDNSIAADETHAPAYKYLSSLEQTYQQWERSAAAAKKYLQYSDGDCGAKLRYAQIAFIAKDFSNVLSTADEIKTCNTNPIIHRLVGISKYEQGKPIEAIPALEKYINTAEKEDIYGLDYGFLGRSYFTLPDITTMEQNRAKGIELMEKAVSMKDTTFDYYTFISDIYKEEKNYNQAVVFLEKAVSSKKKPDGSDFANLGILQFQTQRWKEADGTFEKVKAAYKDTWPQAYALSAKVKIYGNQPDTLYTAAYDTYLEYLKILPEEQKTGQNRDLIDAYFYLIGRELNVTKDEDKAKALLNEILTIAPEETRLLELKASLDALTEGDENEEKGDGSGSSNG